MTESSATALWSKLAASGLTDGDMPPPGEAHTPWYVRVMLGIAGWIAAAFLLGFLGAALAFVMESTAASTGAGFLAIAGAYAVFRAAPRNDFTAMFALALSFAGQVLVGIGVFRAFDHPAAAALPFALMAALEAALAVVMPNFVHRAVSAYAAGLAFSYACRAVGSQFVAAGAVAAAVAAIWLNEARLGRRHAIVTPVGYGLTLSFVQIEGSALFSHAIGMIVVQHTVPSAPPWVGEALVAAALIVTVGVLLRRAGWTPHAFRTLLAVGAAMAIAGASFKAPGIAGGLMIALLGFSNGNRVLVGMGIAALLVYVSGYYYLLDTTLLVKSGVLVATGALLLAARWLVLHVVMPQAPADA